VDTSPEIPYVTKPRQHLSSKAQAEALNLSGIQYPDGTAKKTWAFGYDRKGDDIKIEEVLQSSDLELAVLSSFQIDADCRSSNVEPPFITLENLRLGHFFTHVLTIPPKTKQNKTNFVSTLKDIRSV
jgi:hypothetical protein